MVNMNAVDAGKILEDWHRIVLQCEPDCSVCEKFIHQLTRHVRDNHANVKKMSSVQEVRIKTEVQDSEYEDIETVTSVTAETEPPHQDHVSKIIANVSKECAEEDIDEDALEDAEQNMHIASFLADSIFSQDDDDQVDESVPAIQIAKARRGRPRKYFSNGEKLSKVQMHAKPSILRTRERKHKCTICPMSFSSLSGLDLHKSMHASEFKKLYNCDLCGTEYDNASAIATHKRRAHIFQSSKFEERLYKASDLNLKSNNTLFSCQQCGKTFLHEHNLTAHIITHSRENESKLNLRELTKINEETNKTGTPFQCLYCGVIFDEGRSLSRHMTLIHAPETR